MTLGTARPELFHISGKSSTQKEQVCGRKQVPGFGPPIINREKFGSPAVPAARFRIRGVADSDEIRPFPTSDDSGVFDLAADDAA
jgi:hypothetical protein